MAETSNAPSTVASAGSATLPSRARVVIIGGGVHGASLLYHLVEEGWTDTVLVEKAELTSGSTWHAAGQITRSVLEERTGQAVSLHQPGGIRVAYTDDEVDALKTHLGVGRYIGYPIELLSPTELAVLNPFYDFTDVIAGIWTEGEGHVDPSGVTMAFAGGARAKGAVISRRNRVVEVNALANGDWQVVTEKGTIECEHVVDAAGCYAHQVGLLSGFGVPQANVLHHYLVTEEIPAFVERGIEMPVMRDNRVAGYIRQRRSGPTACRGKPRTLCSLPTTTRSPRGSPKPSSGYRFSAKSASSASCTARSRIRPTATCCSVRRPAFATTG